MNLVYTRDNKFLFNLFLYLNVFVLISSRIVFAI